MAHMSWLTNGSLFLAFLFFALIIDTGLMLSVSFPESHLHYLTESF